MNIFYKELKLSASCLSYIFILFGLMFFIPGYPILCGIFFITLGIFYSFQNARESNDILFSALLPISKRYVVKGKFLFVVFIELISALLLLIVVVIRMTLLKDYIPYRTNKLMNANLFALSIAFLMFGMFNLVFLGGFFKTAYKFSKPFVEYIVISFIIIGVGEGLHHMSGLECLNAFGSDYLIIQLLTFFAGIAIYFALTIISYVLSVKRFEKIDL